MPCACEENPCGCSASPDPECPPPCCTKCDLYQRGGPPNLWWEHGPNAEDGKTPGICLLDTMSEDQIIYTLERDEAAREDLFRITTDPNLLALANNVARLPVVEQNDVEQALVNKPNEAASNPFYAIFRGQPPFAQ